MRVTGRCYANVRGRMFKTLWKYTARFKDKAPYMSPALLKKELTIIDSEEKLPEEKWTPPDDPRFWEKPPVTEDPNYHEEQIYMYNHNVRFIEAKKQASILTKSQIFEGMPKIVSDLIDKVEVPDEDKIIQRYIMQSQKWDPTMVRLPKRTDKRKPRWNFQAQYGIPVEKSAYVYHHCLICVTVYFVIVKQMISCTCNFDTFKLLYYQELTIFTNLFQFLGDFLLDCWITAEISMQPYHWLQIEYDPEMSSWICRLHNISSFKNCTRKEQSHQNKIKNILLRNLLRLCQTNIFQKVPGAYNQRQIIFDPYIQVNYHRHDKHIQINGQNEILVTGTDSLKPYANEDLIAQSVQEELPDMYPLLPVIDLVKEHIYTLDNYPGWKTGFPYSNVHTIFNVHTGNWKVEELHGKSLMYCLAYALAHAKNKFGENKLPKPVCVQCVNASETTFNFTFFQLNTLDFENDDGIKNFAWFDGNNHLYKKHLSQPWKTGIENKSSQLNDFNETAFKKLLAVMLYGVKGIENL
ncbi:hypothetical protein KUTeg_013652 [Tegillarca granosa]|uniref:39S ribosomal protein L37, mitochondrial n=1 Tax=Tegillarca granosa TaxID=220873 RepID=A0ABQ9EUB6_TEGGR|nr:hypothetical protein KUTeg_013652 [Tegillarca granosa]